MTIESPSPSTAEQPINTTTKTAPALAPSLPKHTHWRIHFLLWILGTAIVFLTWKLKRLEQHTDLLEERVAKLAASSTTPSLPTPASTPQHPTTSLLTPKATVPVIPAHPSASTVIAASAAQHSPTNPPPAAPPPLPDWVRKASMSVAYSLYREGNWEATTNLLETLRNSGSGEPQPQVENLWRTLQSQHAALDHMKQQLKKLEAEVSLLPLRNDRGTQNSTSSATTSVGLQLWREVQNDLSQLINVEPRNAATIRMRNDMAFAWRSQMIQSLRAYHLAWLQGNQNEQTRLHHYIDKLLNYAFDTQSPAIRTFQDTFDDWVQQPALVQPNFPIPLGEPS